MDLNEGFFEWAVHLFVSKMFSSSFAEKSTCISFGSAFAAEALCLFGLLQCLLTCVAAAVLMFCLTGVALDKEQVTGRIGAIGMIIARLSALVASGDHLFADALTHALVEDKILAHKTIFQSLVLHLSGIFDDAALELMHLAEALMLEPGGSLFTTYASCAVHDYIVVFFTL